MNNNMNANGKKDQKRRAVNPNKFNNTVNLRKNDNIASEFSTKGSINTDPLGSWTGVPTDDPYEKPIQDADDL